MASLAAHRENLAHNSESPATASLETATPTCVNPLKATISSPQHSYRLMNQEMLLKNYRQNTMIVSAFYVYQYIVLLEPNIEIRRAVSHCKTSHQLQCYIKCYIQEYSLSMHVKYNQ